MSTVAPVAAYQLHRQVDCRVAPRHVLTLRLTLAATALCLLATAAFADDAHDNALFDEILKLSPTPPVWGDLLPEPPPSADAPIEELAEYWSFAPTSEMPGPRIPPRLLGWSESHPEDLGKLLLWFPKDSPAIHDRVLAILKRIHTDEAIDDPLLKFSARQAGWWLMINSRYFLSELADSARDGFSRTEGNAISHFLEPLSRLDPKAADQILFEFATSKDHFQHTAALTWLHRLHASEADRPDVANWRAELQRTVADTAASMRSRDYAVVGLMSVPWAGQEDWFLGLFGDSTIFESRSGQALLRPIRTVVWQNPARWLPKITALAAGSKSGAQTNARDFLERESEWRPGLGPREYRDASRQPPHNLSGDEIPAQCRELARHLGEDALTPVEFQQIMVLRSSMTAEVRKQKALHGFPRGVQVALAGTPTEIDGLLHGNDRGARLGLLLSARWLPLNFPHTAVTALFISPDPYLHRGADLYLRHGDALAARGVAPQDWTKPQILGGFGEYESEHLYKETEESLQKKLMEENGPKEIVAYLDPSRGPVESTGQKIVLVYPDKTILRQIDGSGRYRERQAPPEAADGLRSWIAHHRADDFPLYDQGSTHTEPSLYLHLVPGAGRRVLIDRADLWGSRTRAEMVIENSGSPAQGPGPSWPDSFAPGFDTSSYARLAAQFNALFRPRMEVIYGTLRTLPGFQLLHVKEDGEAVALWRDHDRLEIALKGDDSLTDAFASWRLLRGTQLDSEEIPVPGPLRWGAGLGQWEDEFQVDQRSPDAAVEDRFAGTCIWTGSRKKTGENGIWLGNGKQEPKLLAAGSYAAPVVSAGGEWITALEKLSSDDLHSSESLVVIEVASRHKVAVKQPAPNRLTPVAWLSDRHQFLLRAPEFYADLDYPWDALFEDDGKYFLLDPQSERITAATGEFRPFLRVIRRRLQPTDNPGEYWAAISRYEFNRYSTEVGRYDANTFKFQIVITVPDLLFPSRNLWVDEAAHRFTFIANGDVLRLALP